MRSLNECKREIYKRSDKRISRRKEIRNCIFAGVATVTVSVAACIIIIPILGSFIISSNSNGKCFINNENSAGNIYESVDEQYKGNSPIEAESGTFIGNDSDRNENDIIGNDDVGNVDTDDEPTEDVNSVETERDTEGPPKDTEDMTEVSEKKYRVEIYSSSPDVCTDKLIFDEERIKEIIYVIDEIYNATENNGEITGSTGTGVLDNCEVSYKICIDTEKDFDVYVLEGNVLYKENEKYIELDKDTLSKLMELIG